MAASSRSAARRSWALLDPRLLLGVMLVAASVLGVHQLLQAQQQRVQLYAAKQTLLPGQELTAELLTPVEVQLDPGVERYFPVGTLPERSTVVTRTVGSGELLPVSAVGSGLAQEHTTVVFPLNQVLPEGIVRGSLVELWSARASGYASFETPELLAADVRVVRIVDDAEGMFQSARSGSAIEVLVPREVLARCLEAIVGGEAVSIVPGALAMGQ